MVVTNQRILVFIAFLMMGVFIMMAYSFNREYNSTIGESIDEAVEEIQDEFDDHIAAR